MKLEVRQALFVGVILLTNQTLAQTDGASPDDVFEERLNRIYQKYSAEKTPDSDWQKIAGPRISETYAIQAGDTLWDISGTLFGSGHFWPKIWQLNSKITNPHEISPGGQLTFTSGNELQAPSIQVTESPQADELENSEYPGTLVANNANSELTSDVAAPPLPPPEKQSRPPLKQIPKSLPDVFGYSGGGIDDSEITSGRLPPKIKSPMRLPTYFAEVPPFSQGEVQEVETGLTTALDYQYVFLKMAPGAEKGRYIVFQARQKLSVEVDSQTVEGYPVDYIAEVDLLDRVDGTENLYRAVVLHQVSQVFVGASVIKGTIPSYQAEPTNQRSYIPATIVGGQFENKRLTFMIGDIVYLDRGSNQGLKVNDTIPVIKNFKARKLSDDLAQLKLGIGEIRVVKTTPERSTAVVVSGIDEIAVGDTLGRILNPQRGGSSVESGGLQIIDID